MHLLLRYTQALITQMAQTAVCNRHHSLDQQLCRWLLLSLDRLPGNELVMTQELIANMLGVRREGVTEAAQKLQEAGLIRYARGHITVLDRPALESAHLRVLCRGEEGIRPAAAAPAGSPAGQLAGSSKQTPAATRRCSPPSVPCASCRRVCSLAHRPRRAHCLACPSAMKRMLEETAALSQATPQALVLRGSWTARGIGAIESQLEAVRAAAGSVADATGIEALDTAGAWVLHRLLHRAGGEGIELRGLRPEFARLLDAVAQRHSAAGGAPGPARQGATDAGSKASAPGVAAAFEQAIALLGFVGETALALAGQHRAPGALALAADPVQHPQRRLRRAADRRAAVVPARDRGRLPGRRPAAAVRRQHLRRRPGRACRCCASSRR